MRGTLPLRAFGSSSPAPAPTALTCTRRERGGRRAGSVGEKDSLTLRFAPRTASTSPPRTSHWGHYASLTIFTGPASLSASVVTCPNSATLPYASPECRWNPPCRRNIIHVPATWFSLYVRHSIRTPIARRVSEGWAFQENVKQKSCMRYTAHSLAITTAWSFSYFICKFVSNTSVSSYCYIIATNHHYFFGYIILLSRWNYSQSSSPSFLKVGNEQLMTMRAWGSERKKA